MALNSAVATIVTRMIAPFLAVAAASTSTIAASDIQTELCLHSGLHVMLCLHSGLQLSYIRLPPFVLRNNPRPTDKAEPKLNHELSQLQRSSNCCLNFHDDCGCSLRANRPCRPYPFLNLAGPSVGVSNATLSHKANTLDS